MTNERRFFEGVFQEEGSHNFLVKTTFSASGSVFRYFFLLDDGMLLGFKEKREKDLSDPLNTFTVRVSSQTIMAIMHGYKIYFMLISIFVD